MSISAAELQATVLCLDDDEATLDLLEAFLPRHGPFEVLAEARAAGATEAMQKGGPDRLESLASTLAAISDSDGGS